MSPPRRPAAAGAGLFDAGAEAHLSQRGPLAHRMRPRTLDEMVGQSHLVGPGAPLRALIETDRLSSAILWGPPGTGKTTLARLVAETTGREFATLSAVSAGVADVRAVLEDARRRLGERGQGTILFLDEVHRFNKAQQDALLPSVESGQITLIGATTENPSFALNAALLSRTTLYRLNRLEPAEVAVVLGRGLELEGAEADADALEHLVAMADGDVRAGLTILETAIALAGLRAGDATAKVGLGDAEAAADRRALRYGTDEHYDVVSAFIKSIRGSDPDAGLYWLARMVEAGEDPRFIARRLVILASEDVGMADPTALLVAEAASSAVDHVGLPEAGLNLAQSVVHLATAPKSNRVASAWWRAQADVRDRPADPVPAHLRDASYRSAHRLGHGVDYRYPHDDPRGWVEQVYRPEDLVGRVYYEPSDHGREAGLAWGGEVGESRGVE